MTYPPNWPQWPSRSRPDYHDMMDRDQQRDRLRDLEHVAHSIAGELKAHSTRHDQTEHRLRWHEAALGLMAWVLFNKTLATWTPEMADLIAGILKGLAR